MSNYRHAGAKGDWRHSSYFFLNSALDGGEWSASRLAMPYPRYPMDRKLGGAQNWSGHTGLYRGSNAGYPVCSQTLTAIIILLYLPTEQPYGEL
jgi:hypothetical protein